ncbi:MAG: hypothetical protein QNK04_21815 [Myxococcota bacterium]|nr:hypothetical protein [Myxococcota bacterium]
MNGSYPPGYAPKRESALMPKLPHLKAYTADLAAYLAASAAPSGTGS